MPTYEYKCPAGHVFEKFYPTMNYKRREKCPTCGKPAERQISGGAGAGFKGAGVFPTHHKRAGEKQGEQGAEEKREGQPPPGAKAPRARTRGRGQKKKKPGAKVRRR